MALSNPDMSSRRRIRARQHRYDIEASSLKKRKWFSPPLVFVASLSLSVCLHLLLSSLEHTHFLLFISSDFILFMRVPLLVFCFVIKACTWSGNLLCRLSIQPEQRETLCRTSDADGFLYSAGFVAFPSSSLFHSTTTLFIYSWLFRSQHIEVRLKEGWMLTIHLFDKQNKLIL